MFNINFIILLNSQYMDSVEQLHSKIIIQTTDLCSLYNLDINTLYLRYFNKLSFISEFYINFNFNSS